MRISDWSSDVCSSDLLGGPHGARGDRGGRTARREVSGWWRPALRAFGAAGGMGRYPSMPISERAKASGSNGRRRSEEHTSELQSLMRISYAVFCLKKKKPHTKTPVESNIYPLHTQHTLRRRVNKII